MNRSQVQRFVVGAGSLALLLALPSTADAAPGKGKKKKDKQADAEPEPEPEAEAEDSSASLDLGADEDEIDGDGDAELESAAVAPAGSGMKGRLGLGGTRSLSGVNAISLRYYPIDKLSIGALAGFATFSHKEPDDNGDYTQTNTVGLLGTGLQMFYWPVQGNRDNVVSADFGLGFRGVVYVGFGAEDDENDETLEGPLEIDIEIPLTTHVFIGDAVAITPEFGFVARIIPGNREPDQQDNSDTNPGSGVGERLGTTNGPGLGFEIGEHGGVFFGLSITYFFGGKNSKKRRAKKG